MASSTTALAPTFTAGGLISGLDTNSIVDKLTQLAAGPITTMQTRQAGFQSQISSLGEIAARLSSLQDAATALGKNGVLGVKVSSSNSSLKATPSSSSTAGRYQIEVTNLATAAQARSAAFASPTSAVKGGTLAINVQGTAYNVTIGDGAALSDVALAIRQSGAPVSATVLNDGTHSFLSITNRATGYPIGGTAAQALSITETSTGTLGQALGASIVSPADNAAFTIDGLPFTRTSNTVTDAVPGTTLALNAKSTGGPETLLLDEDADATTKNLQTFVDAYNRAMQLVQSQLAVTQGTDRSTTLAGDSAMRMLQQSLSRLVSTTVGTNAINSLATLGVQTNRDGSLSIDATKLASAMSRDATAVNNVFQDATSGISAAVTKLVQSQTNSIDGILTQDSKGLSTRVTQMDSQVASLQRRVDAYHDNLVRQFAAMESLISKFKATGNFLAAQEANKK
jgi:flagellar hook-associated protein 2